uniref:HAT C-terminal dimerisation domain-containing protein n=1 Tax=Manihot esculenta TaxID=3983 RepID=A0A2C9VVD0_MANES
MMRKIHFVRRKGSRLRKCGLSLMCKTGATTHLLRHLNSCLKRKVNLKGQQQHNITTTIAETESVTSVQNFKYDHAKVREVITHMILVHELSFSFVEYEVFNLLMRAATPYYQKVSHATARKDYFSAYEIEKKKVKALLKDTDKVSVTTDLWKSGQHISYMVVTTHFMDSEWKLQKYTLNFCDVPPPHTGVVICDVLQKCLVEWGIEDKVWTISVDNVSYNDVAVRMLKYNPAYNNSLALHGKLFHVRCCAHILNLLVQDSLSEIVDIIKNVHESVKHLVASESHRLIFSEIAKQLKLPSKKLLLDSALEFKDVFPQYQQRDSSYTYLLSEDDWQKIKEVCSFLEEFNEVTNVISAMVGKMKCKFDKYWYDCNLLISLAAILDPRNKMKLIKWSFPKIYYEFDSDEHITTVMETLRMLYNEYVDAHKIKSIGSEISSGETQKEGSSCTISGKGKIRGGAQFYSYIRNVDCVIEQAKFELDVYLEEGVHICQDDSNFDVLEWWKMNNMKFMILSKIGRDILSIPITTVDSESAFSAGVKIIDPHRASLGAETVQVLTCYMDVEVEIQVN